MLSASAAAGLIAWLCAAAPPAGDVRIEGNVRYEVGTERVLISDGAVLRRGAVVIRARSATYDPATGEVHAVGNVLLTDATHVIAADEVRAVIDGEMEADGVVAFVKDKPVDLSRAATLSQARGLGRNRLSFSGEHLAGDAKRFRLSGARLTLCDCGDGHRPSWEVTARSADVRPGTRAILSWAVLRIAPPLLHRSVPVLALPWLYLPLGERQSGLLLPELRSTPATGYTLAEPIFVTLGRSADATLSPEYSFGPSSPAGADRGTVRGPGARLELRWAPAEAVEGEARLAWVHDLEREPGGTGGDRFGIDLMHAQRASDRTSLRASLHLAGDPVWFRDVTAGVIARNIPYRRSDLLVSHRWDSAVLEAGASYLQPLRPSGIVAGERYGAFGADLGDASRWPEAALTLLPVGTGPLRLSGRVGASRFAPVAGAYDAELRPAADRADARLEIGAPLLLGDVLSLAPYVRGAASADAFEAAVAPRESAWGVAGAVLGTEVSRRFGEIRHVVAPRVEWRAGTAAAGGTLPWPSYDMFDRSQAGLLSAAPAGTFHQLRASVESRLHLRDADMVRVEVGQDVDLRRGRVGETFGGASVARGPFSGDVSARLLAFETRATPLSGAALERSVLPGRLDRFSELRASAALVDRRGDAVRASFLGVGPGGSGVLVAGIDPLFDLRPAAVQASALATAGVRVVAGGATLGYDAILPGRATLLRRCSDTSLVPTDYRTVEGWGVREHVASLTWASRCRCFKITALVRVDDCGNVSPTASIDLSGLADAARSR